MKLLIMSLLLGISFTISAQEDDCKYNITTTNDGVELKATQEYLMYEKVFAGTSQFMFFSLSNNDGMPVLNYQYLAKGKDFPKVYCIDKNSRIYLQLANGKIVTLVSASEDECGGLVYDSGEQNNIRILTASFLFTKGSLEDLEKSPITFIRVKYVTDTVDYNIKKELQSEGMSKQYFPERYFINTLKCIQ